MFRQSRILHAWPSPGLASRCLFMVPSRSSASRATGRQPGRPDRAGAPRASGLVVRRGARPRSVVRADQRDRARHRHRRPPAKLVPAQAGAGIRSRPAHLAKPPDRVRGRLWTPACAGVTMVGRLSPFIVALGTSIWFGAPFAPPSGTAVTPIVERGSGNVFADLGLPTPTLTT